MMEATEAFWKTLTEINVLLYQHSDKTQKNKARTSVTVLQRLSSIEQNLCPDYFDALFIYGDDKRPINEQTLVRLGQGLYQFASVPEFTGHEDIWYDISDFQGIAEKAEKTLAFFSLLLVSIHRSIPSQFHSCYEKMPQFYLTVILRAIMLAAEHAIKDLWTSPKSLAAAGALVQCVLNTTSCSTLYELLCDPPRGSPLTKGLAALALQNIKPRLQKGVWKRSPSCSRVFQWILIHMKFPHVGGILELVLPPSLLLTDDHQTEHKVMGMQCLHHIMKETTREELRWYGRAEVVYEAIQHQLYTQEEPLLCVALPALYNVLAVVEQQPSRTDPPRPETRYDTILERLLQSMELENKLVLRRLYASHIPRLLESMGPVICRHLPRLLQVTYSYLEVFDGPREEARFSALDILETIIRQAWPRMPHHTVAILKGLLRLVYDVSTDRTTTLPEVNERLVSRAISCAKMLRLVGNGSVEELLADIASLQVNPSCTDFAGAVLASETPS